MDEDQLSSYFPSPTNIMIKARRRHARIPRDDIANFDTAFLSPRPAPCPPSRSNSLKLDLFKYPQTPFSESSPRALSSEMPSTPSTSDSEDDLALPSPRFNPRRAAIQPLVFSFNRDVDSDTETSSVWLHNEFSKIIANPRSEQVQPTTARVISTLDAPSQILPSPQNLPTPPSSLVNFSRPPPRSSLPADCVNDLYDLYMDEGDTASDSSSAFSLSMYEIDFAERQDVVSPYTSDLPSSTCPQSPCSISSKYSIDSEGVEVGLDDACFELDVQLRLPLSIPTTPLDLEADISTTFEKLREQKSVQKEQELEATSVASEETAVSVQTTPQSPPSMSSVQGQDSLYTPTISTFSFCSSPSLESFCEKSNDPLYFNTEESALKSKWSAGTVSPNYGYQARSSEDKDKNGESSKFKLSFGGGGSTPSKTTSNKLKKHASSSSKSVIPPVPTSILFRSSLASQSSPSRKGKTYSPSPSPSPSPFRWAQWKSKQTNAQIKHSMPTHQSSYSEDIIVIGYGHDEGLKRRGSSATVRRESGYQ